MVSVERDESTSRAEVRDERSTTEKVHYAGRFLELAERDGWCYARRPNEVGVAAIVAVTDKGELVLTEQFRIPLGKSVIDLPAGLSSSSEAGSVVETASRELEEETGFIAQSFQRLFERPTSPGLTNEVVTYVRARDLIRRHGGGGLEEEGESITVHLVPLSEIDVWMTEMEKQGKLLDPKVDVALRVLSRDVGS